MQTAPADRLAAAGIHLSAPMAPASVTRDQAESAALNQVPDSAIRESVLAQLDDVYVVPAVHQNAWIVSVMPPGGIDAPVGGPYGVTATPQPRTFFLVIIDANTGNYLFR